MAAQTLPAPRSTGSAPPQTKRLLSIADITSKGSGLPNRYILHAVEGWGKTSFGAQTPAPVFIQTNRETGLETLIDAGRLAEVPHFPAAEDWQTVLGYVDVLISENHGFKTLIIDTINGAEALCFDHICRAQFGGKWGNDGFAAYGKGPEVSVPEWIQFLNKLDRLRSEKRMTIFALCHTKVKPFKNPMGADYDRFQPDMHEKIWGISHKWADCVLFGNFEVTLVGVQEGKSGAKGKAVGGKYRMLYTERDAAYDAKNRLGLAAEVEMGESPAEAWGNFIAAVKAGRGQA